MGAAAKDAAERLTDEEAAAKRAGGHKAAEKAAAEAAGRKAAEDAHFELLQRPDLLEPAETAKAPGLEGDAEDRRELLGPAPPCGVSERPLVRTLTPARRHQSSSALMSRAWRWVSCKGHASARWLFT